ncbi:MAG: hypothetical protein EAZ98_17080 [Oscillatoriales cyanobacterium]|nr:MAG: hypothetical protein EAZ98_17080 [Oscillatoriales cyanobacterium]TAF69443.1 MAG: hypothetical protein EAZ59_08590 [Oscillatoriales cyanobacterium]
MVRRLKPQLQKRSPPTRTKRYPICLLKSNKKGITGGQKPGFCDRLRYSAKIWEKTRFLWILTADDGRCTLMNADE